MASEFSMEINVDKTRVMAFRGMEPIISKICINNKKVVPLHAMEALGGRGGIAPTHSRPRH
jgi:hypothetical protein